MLESFARFLEERRAPAVIEGTEFFTAQPWRAPGPPAASSLGVSTLTAVTSYLRDNRDALDLKKAVFAHIESPNQVSIVGTLRGDRTREEFLIAKCSDLADDLLGRWRPREEFQIQLMTRFAPNDQLDELVKLVGNIHSGATRKVTDDGVSQEVTVQKTVGSVERRKLGGRFSLRPHRSFPEIEPTEQVFLFRIKDTGTDISCCLFEADGGRWKVPAIAAIAEYLVESGLPVPVIG